MLKKGQASLPYRLLHQKSKLDLSFWFNRIAVCGQENIPEGQPCVLIPCHQNALMDCVSLLSVYRQPILFFARSDVFSNPIVAKLMTFLKIMPAYRQKEGFENIIKNEQNFQEAVKWVVNGQPLCMMPEGGQNEKHCLRSFVKGPFRIAFLTQEQMPKEKSVFLLPVGIYHQDYNRCGFDLVLNFGQPIPIQDYFELYQETPAKALNRIKDDAHQALKPLMFHIDKPEHYHAIEVAARSCIGKANQNPLATMKQQQQIVDKLSMTGENDLQQLEQIVEALSGEDINLATKAFATFSSRWRHLCFAIIALPFLLLFAVVYSPFLLLFALVNKKMWKSGFCATIKYGIFVLLFPLYRLILALIVALSVHSIGLGLLFWLLCLFLALFGVKNSQLLFILKYQFLKPKVRKILKNLKDTVDNIAE